MASEFQNTGSSPPLPPDEAYWEALLQEGDGVAVGGSPRQRDLDWEDFDIHEATHSLTDGSPPAGSQPDWDAIQQVYDRDETIDLQVSSSTVVAGGVEQPARVHPGQPTARLSGYGRQPARREAGAACGRSGKDQLTPLRTA